MTTSQIVASRLRAYTGAVDPGAHPSILTTSPSAAQIFGATQFVAPPVTPAAVLPPDFYAIAPAPAADHTKLWIGLGLAGAALAVLLLSRRSS